jgi:hypothetical protein
MPYAHLDLLLFELGAVRSYDETAPIIGRRIVGQGADSARHLTSDDTVEISLRVNGSDRVLDVQPQVSLLDALREYLGLTGTKKGCDQGACGARVADRQRRATAPCVRLDPELRDALAQRAERDDETASSVIRKALRQYLKVG